MRILFIASPDRPDWYDYLGQDTSIKYSLLWHESKAMDFELNADFPIKFERQYFWQDFSTPQKLLNAVCPDKIVFFEIIDFRQIALIVAAKAKNIPTFYVEHGAAGDAQTAISRWNEFDFTVNFTAKAKRFFGSFGKVVRAKYFYYAACGGLRSLGSLWMYLTIPFKSLGALPNKVLANNIFEERVPENCIVFNRKIREQFAVYTGLKESDALLTGIPFFDKYHRSLPISKDYIVYIDHPYCEDGIFGWGKEHHASVAAQLFAFAERRNLKVLIKLHPRSNKQLWESYSFDASLVQLLQFEDCTNYFLESKLILGFSSSLLTAFLCAKKNVVLLGWHPVPEIKGTDFSQYGICHTSFSPSDLNSEYDRWCSTNLCVDSLGFDKFIIENNDPFDGKATERVLKAIKTL
ncbi:MAG: hypothetical protein JST36_09835 [Bacteroidetes bacterium]|nr:hypothetical protein [Bacteroidota bacterium]